VDVELAVDELLAQGDELRAVDGRLLVGQDEEPDLVLLDQGLSCLAGAFLGQAEGAAVVEVCGSGTI